MNISGIIAGANESAKTKNDLAKILDYPGLCSLLTDYYRNILKLKPANKHQAIDKEMLAMIISWAFSKITVMLKLYKDADLSEIIFNICCMLKSRLIMEFECHGENLNNMITDIIMNYCYRLPDRGEKLMMLFLEQINKKNTLTGTGKTMRRSSSNNTLICHNKAVESLIVAELDSSGWIHIGSSIVFFSHNEEIIYVVNKRLCHLALFLRKAREAQLIQPEFGTGYIEIVSKHLFYLGKPVRKKYFKRLCSEVWKNAKNNYDDEHNTVSRIIDRISKVRNTESQM